MRFLTQPQNLQKARHRPTSPGRLATPGSTLTIGKDVYNLVRSTSMCRASMRSAASGARSRSTLSMPDGRLAVVGVFMKAGRKNAAFAAIMKVAPRSDDEKALAKPVDPRQFLPANRALYRYKGSLTTPPCSEVVDWNVYEHPIEVAAEDIEAFKVIFPMNARPLQPVNRRCQLRGM
jgi:carbonic anhydrase